MRNYLIYLLSPIIRTLLGIAVQIPITTYYLAPRDFGLFALVTGITGLISSFAMPTPQWVLSTHFVTSEDQAGLVTTLLATAIGLHIAWAIPVFLIGPVLTPLLVSDVSTQGLYFYFGIAVLGVALSAPFGIAQGVLVLQRRAVASATIEIVAFATNVTVTASVLFFYGPRIEALFLGPIAQGLVASTASLSSIRAFVSLSNISTQWLREIFRIACHGIPNAIGESLATMIERVVISHSMSLASLAYYTHSQRYRQVMQMGLTSAKSVITPDAVDAYAVGEGQTTMSRNLAFWATALNLGGIICALFATDIVSFLTHGKFAPAGPLVFAWWIVVVAGSVGLPYAQYLVIHRQTRTLLVSGIISATVTILGIIFLVPRFHFWGIFAAILACTIALQLYRRNEALKRGCPSIPEAPFLLGAVGNSALYFAQLMLDLSLKSRLIIFAFVAFILATGSYASIAQITRGQDNDRT